MGAASGHGEQFQLVACPTLSSQVVFYSQQGLLLSHRGLVLTPPSVIANVVAGNWADQRGDQQVNDQSPMMIMMRDLYTKDTTLQLKVTYYVNTTNLYSGMF